MNVKSFCLGGLVMACLGLGTVRGQGPDLPYKGGMDGLPPGPAAEADHAPPVPPTGTMSLSSWILYPRGPGCCGPVGSNGPISGEVYLNAGVELPIGGNIFGHELQTGWAVEGGLRSLFFNPAVDAAWTVSLGISNIYNTTAHDESVTLKNVPVVTTGNATMTVPQVNVTLASLNRTYVNLSGGREWWLWGKADDPEGSRNLRVGFEAGGRYGTGKVEFNEIVHKTDILGGLFVAIHANVEVPYCGCVFVAGIRGEYSYTWNDILQRQNPSDLQDINLLFTVGARF
jgi:hypothetical protein